MFILTRGFNLLKKQETFSYEPRREKTFFLHMRKNKDADQLRGNREGFAVTAKLISAFVFAT